MAWPSEAGSQHQIKSLGIPTPAVGTAVISDVIRIAEPTLSFSRHLEYVTVEATSSLAGLIYYFWYIDGAFLARTTSNIYTFFIREGEQFRISVKDSNNSNYDYLTHAPVGYSARRTLFWTRCTDSDILKYNLEQNKAAGGWTDIGTVNDIPGQWSYMFVTERLDDLTSYQFRVLPVDQAGNEGTALTLTAETIVRTPDAPDYTVTFDPDTDKVTYASA